jgi:hypothetical protein
LKPSDYIVRVPSGNGDICVSGFQGVDVAPPGNYNWDYFLNKILFFKG